MHYFMQVSHDEYRAKDGATIKREYGETPNGNATNGQWVLRDSYGIWIDYDTYRNDLAERHGHILINQGF